MKKRIKGLLVLCTVLTLIMSCVCGVNAAPGGPAKNKIQHTKHYKVPKRQGLNKIKFIDLRDTHWAYIAISDLSDRGIIIGYSDNSFRPNEQVTRSQFATMLVKSLGLETKSKTQTFKDVPAKRWDFKAVEAAKAYLTGYKKSDGKLYFYGERSAVREDMAVALVKALELTVVSDGGELEKVFDDYESISENLRDFVYTAYKEGIMFGSDGKFNPQGSLTRAEAAALLEKLIEKTEKVVIDDEIIDEDKVVLGDDSDATLSNLKYDGMSVKDFDKDDTYYVVELDDDDEIPTVTAKAAHENATVAITQAEDLPGYAKIVVEAEDGVTRNIYYIKFEVKVSSDATLKAIKYDNKDVENFDADKTYYTIALEDDEDIPVVTAVANDSQAELTVVQATYLPGTAKVYVKAENGAENTYKIRFVIEE